MSEPVSQSGSRGAWLRFAGVIVAIAACAVGRWYIAQGPPWEDSSLVFVVGAVAAALLLGRPHPMTTLTAVAAPAEHPRGRAVLGLGIAVVGVAALAYGMTLLTADWFKTFDRGAPILLAGIALWSIGLAVWDIPRHGTGTVRMPRWELLLFLGIVAFGFFLRFYHFPQFPPPDGFCAVEEPQSGMGAYNIIHGGYRPWEFVFDRWMPVPFFKWMGETIIALRVPFIIVSALTIIPVYLLLRLLVSRGAALFATTLFAMCSWHLIYARLGHAVFPPTLIVMLIFYLCVRVHRRGGVALYPLIGFLTASTLYSYAGYRGTPLFVGLFFLISLGSRLVASRRAADADAQAAARQALMTQVVGLAMAAIAFGSLIPPLVSQLRANPVYFFEAANRSLDNPAYYTHDPKSFVEQRLFRLRLTAMMFNHVGDGSETFNLPGAPMLEPVSGILFAIGLAYCLIWARYRFQGFFAATFLVLLIMGTTFVQNFDIRRLQGIIPLIFVLIAYTVDRFGQMAVARLGARVRPVLAAGAVLLLGFAFRNNYNIYFAGMMHDPRVLMAFQNPFTMAIRYLHELPDNAYLLLMTDQQNFFYPNDFSWWRGDRVPGRNSADLLPLVEGERGPWGDRELHVLIADPFEREDLAQLITESVPGAHCEPWAHPDRKNFPKYIACTVPPGAKGVGFDGGIHARYFHDDSAKPFLERTEPVVSFGFVPDACRFQINQANLPCRAEWEGTWNVPASGVYDLLVQVRQGEVALYIDGQRYEKPLTLEAGPHSVRIEARYRSIEEAGVRLRVRSTDEGLSLIRFATLHALPPGN